LVLQGVEAHFEQMHDYWEIRLHDDWTCLKINSYLERPSPILEKGMSLRDLRA
jgi:hypothetical protein